MNNLLKLSKAAESQSQAAFSVLSKSMQFEWSYLQRILSGCEEAFIPIWNTLNQHFWPAIFGGTISDNEKQLFLHDWAAWEFAIQLKVPKLPISHPEQAHKTF